MSELYRPGVTGCTDGNCMLVKNTGMVTNGGCQCESDIRRVPHGFDAIRTIHFLRDQLRDADAELERLRADAERYRETMLRNVGNCDKVLRKYRAGSHICDFSNAVDQVRQSLRAAIDEARKG